MKLPPVRLAAALALGLAAGTAPAETARAADRVQVVPSRVEVRAARGDTLPPVSVVNRGSAPITVRAHAVPATQEVSGLPRYDFGARSRQEGRAMFALSPNRFSVPPGAARQVRVRVLACPRSGLGTYGVVGFAARQLGARSRGQVAPVIRLASTLLVQAPSRPCIEGRAMTLRGEQRADRVAFVTRVRNVGNLHAKPDVRVSLFRDGRLVSRSYAAAENVIPGGEREFEILAPGRLARGSYVAQADVWMGWRHTRIRQDVHLTATNRLPTARLAIAALRIDAPEPGDPSKATVTVANRGTAAADAELRMRVAGDGRTLEEKIIALEDVAAGGDRAAEIAIAALPEGAYDLEAELLRDGARVDSRVTSFAVDPDQGLLTRLVDWLAAHVLLVLAGLVLVFAVLAAAGIAVLRRRRGGPAGPSAGETLELADLRAALDRLEQADRDERLEQAGTPR